ncbi:MAG: translesion DNA synthesis-associated protein ImuA [Gammaproteobacteria bacterium]|nr:translesion DNA synthesis-associated protein ImuA [Gammaproteobacteria bacterium]
MHTQDSNPFDNNPPARPERQGSPERVRQLLAQTPGLWQGKTPAGNVYLHPTAVNLQATRTHSAPADLFTEDPVESDTPCQSTGFQELDNLLPGGGWPVSGLVEIISRHKAIGELQLLMPLLRLRSHQQQSLLWITPPYTLHGPALANSGVNIRNSFVIPSQTRCNNALWSIEKALQSTECGMVLAWQNWLSARVVRRLQLAASEGKTLGVLFHQRAVPHSPATLQLEISAAPMAVDGCRQINVRLMKAKGSYRQGEVRLRLPG